MTLDGFTALSVEIMTKAEAPAARVASATLRVPRRLVSIPSTGLSSTMGTCLSAAAWKTTSGPTSANSARMRLPWRTSTIRGRIGTPGNSSEICRVTDQRLNSELSTRTRRRGAKRAIWRTSSEPIEPPAPVTMTSRSLISRSTSAMSRSTSWRPRRSSSAIGSGSIGRFSSTMPVWLMSGSRLTVTPSGAQVATMRDSRAAGMSTSVTTSSPTGVPRFSAQAMVCSSSASVPSTRMPCNCRRRFLDFSSMMPTMASCRRLRRLLRMNRSALSLKP